MTVQMVSRDPSTERSAADRIDLLRSRLDEVLRGKAEVVEKVVVCLLAQGHLLLEDRPGLGKTTLAKSLAEAVGGRFARIQCTPDLLPSDVTGFNLFNQKTQQFEFHPGPVFSDVLLADEVNRATPRTQSALLEAMAERQVTVDAVRHRLSKEFFVIATQNPADQHGTYPLPEAQLDRFAMKLSIGYPGRDDELHMLADALQYDGSSDEPAEPVLTRPELETLQRIVARLDVALPVREYLVRLADATRKHSRVALGVSPRGLLIWQRAAQAQALVRHRSYVTPDDVQSVAIPVLSVRLLCDSDNPASIIESILHETPVPPWRVAEGARHA